LSTSTYLYKFNTLDRLSTSLCIKYIAHKKISTTIIDKSTTKYSHVDNFHQQAVDVVDKCRKCIAITHFIWYHVCVL